MRSCLLIVVVGLGPWLLWIEASRAAIIKGRVVDSAGRPVAGAEVRIWQKLADAGGVIADKQVNFGDGDVTITDADGRFITPDVLAGEAFARIVAEAKGTLAVRSGWMEIPNGATVVAPNIVLKRLRAVIGQVRDREGRPVADAVVFNAGDGHDRVETKTGRNGKFFLEAVPEGPVFLFVEKSDYRFTGMRLPAGQSVADFTLASVEETVEPLVSLPPLLSAEEETGLARKVLEPWLREMLRAGTDEQKFFVLAAVSSIDPLEALKGVDVLGIRAPGFRAISHDGFLQIAVSRSSEFAHDRLRAAIESGEQPFGIASELAIAAHTGAENERSRKVEWLEAALVHARRVEDDALRIEALALICDSLFVLGERERAATILAEAEALARLLPEHPRSSEVFGFLAVAVVHNDARRASDWLERMKGDRDYSLHGVELAMRLLPEQPDLAQDVWNRSQAGNRMPRPDDLLPLPWQPRAYLPDFCHRLALSDRPRAEQIAAAAEPAALRIRGHGAVALALAETQPAEARRLVESLVREELPRVFVDDGLQFRHFGSRPTNAAWLLPIAERVAPELCREIFWRSLALRLPRPRRDHFDDEIEITDLQLSRMLARYDRAVARALVEPFASRVAQTTYAGATELKSRHALQAAASATRWSCELTIAAAHADPHWGLDLLERVPYGRAGSRFHPADFARRVFVWTLSRHGADRWCGGNDICAGFWEPHSN